MKQKLLLAQALGRHGFQVDVVTPDASRLTAYGYDVHPCTPDEARRRAPYDVSIVTWFETWRTAQVLSPLVVHFCQGYEGDLPHLAGRMSDIRALYSAALPSLVVSPHLAVRLEREFGTVSQLMQPLLDVSFRPRFGRRVPHRRPIVLVHGIFQSAVKRLKPALDAVERVRERRPLRLFRIATMQRADEEPDLRPGDRFWLDIVPGEVARITRRADLTLFTSDAGEGFGLPVLESLASGIPVVAVRIPSLAVFEHLDVIHTVDSADPAAIADAMEAALSPATWRLFRRRGLLLAKLWRAAQQRRTAVAFNKLLRRTAMQDS